MWGDGPINAKIMLIGEAPGANEERTGIPFKGAAGEQLNTLLRQAGLKREDIYISNVVKCRPPNNRPPTDAEASACFTYLAEEITRVKPKVIVALGNSSLKLLTGKSGITAERGRIIPPKAKIRIGDAVIVGTFHPAALLHSNVSSMRSNIVQDLIYAGQLAGIGKVAVQPEHVAAYVLPNNTAQDLEDALVVLKDCKVVSVDCEWTAVPENIRKSIAWPWTSIPKYKTELYSVSISGRVGDVIYSVGVALPQFKNKTAVLQKFFSDHPAVFHNAMADLIWLFRLKLGIKLVGDTMVLFHLFDETQRVSLEQLCVLNLGMQPWKGPLWGQRPESNEVWIKLLSYNCTDTYGTLLLAEEGHRQLRKKSDEERENITRMYSKVILPEIPVFVEMAHLGIPLDEEELIAQIKQTNIKLHDAIHQLADKTGMTPRSAEKLAMSPAQTVNYVHDVLGVTIAGATKGDLLDLEDRFPLIKNIQTIKYWNKRKGTYLGPWLQLITEQGDGCLHSVYRITSSRTGRTSAEVELGGSLQLAPRDDIKQVIKAPPGFVLLNGDFSNIEMRIAAWLANERRMIQLFNEGADLHTTTAAFMHAFQEDKLTVSEFWPIREKYFGLVTPDDRQAAKGINFGFLYGMGAAKFQLYAKQNYRVEFTLEEAEAARRGYFALYADLEAWHNAAYDIVRRGYTVTPLGRYRRVIEDERKAINTPVQATATDIASIVMTDMRRRLDEFPRGSDPSLRGFVHDNVVVLAREEYATESIIVMKHIMETPPLARLGIVIPVPLIAEVKATKSLGK